MAKQTAYIELAAPLKKLTSDLNKAQTLVSARIKAMSASINIGMTGAYASAGVAAQRMGTTAVLATGAVAASLITVSTTATAVAASLGVFTKIFTAIQTVGVLGFGAISAAILKVIKPLIYTKGEIAEWNKLLKEDMGKAFLHVKKIGINAFNTLAKKVGTTFEYIKKTGAKSLNVILKKFSQVGKSSNRLNPIFIKLGGVLKSVGITGIVYFKMLQVGIVNLGKMVLTVASKMWVFGKAIVGACRAGIVAFGRLIKKIAVFAMAIGKIVLVLGVITAAFIAKGIQMAMAFEEAESMFEKVFLGMSDSVRVWSEDLQKRLGVSADEARKFAATMSSMFTSMNLGAKEAKNMAINLTQLSYDISSFKNIKPEEAFEKLQSAISGSPIALRKLGYSFDQTSLKAFAVENGIIALGETMSEEQKVIARYGIIMQKTSQAHDNAEITATSTKNTYRALGVEIADLTREIGQIFLPVFHKVLVIFRNFFKENSGKIKSFFSLFSKGIGISVQAFAEFSIEIVTFWKKIAAFLEFFGKNFAEGFKYGFDSALIKIKYFIKGVWGIFKHLSDYLKNFGENIWKWIWGEEDFALPEFDTDKMLEGIGVAMAEAEKELEGIRPKSLQLAYDKIDDEKKKQLAALRKMGKKEGDQEVKDERQKQVDLAAIAKKFKKEKAKEELKEKQKEKAKEGMRKFIGRFGATRFSHYKEKAKEEEKIEANESTSMAPPPITVNPTAVASSKKSKYTIDNVVKGLGKIEEKMEILAGKAFSKNMAIV